MLPLVICLLTFVDLAAPTFNPTNAPTNVLQPTPLVIPTLPISKLGARYPDASVEVMFVLDVSGSVSKPNQKKMFQSVAGMIIDFEAEVGNLRFGVVVFGFDGTVTNSKRFYEGGIATSNIHGPYGNGLSELFLELDSLRYDCTNCTMQNGQTLNRSTSWSQLDLLANVDYDGWLTPTWDGLDRARTEFVAKGNPGVPSRLTILLTDGVPNDGNCYDITTPQCVAALNYTNRSVESIKQIALLMTVGVLLNNETQIQMTQWTSEPRAVLAAATADYSGLTAVVPKTLNAVCPVTVNSGPCVPEGSTLFTVVGSNFINTGLIACRFIQGGSFVAQHQTPGSFVDTTQFTCLLPTDAGFGIGQWNINYTFDGRGYHAGPVFRYGCSSAPTSPTSLNPTSAPTGDTASGAPLWFPSIVSWCSFISVIGAH